MAFINENGEKISYECSALIDDLKHDIDEFGGNTIVAVWCKKTHGVEVYTNYDFIDETQPLKKEELKEGEFIKTMTMTALLLLFKTQNEIL